ncbi:caspase family protein [Nonomuraea candida]|uniref:caspase family protein n=1 Tax=Nonomuraea candida TaxID=359159 RepID=UPI0005BA6BD7|nr:caspase family protein [Nonomuraea candida]
MTGDERWAGASQAILIATSVHQDESLPDLPAAANSLMGLRSVLTDPYLCGWPAYGVSVLHNEGDSRVVAQRIRQAARETTGVLLLYFAGHGLLTPEGELCLALADTVADDPDLTGLEYSRIRNALRGSPAAVKIAILDCCYAGTVIETESLSAHASLVADQSDVRGVYTLTASDLAAHVVPFDEQPDACTSFTGELLHLIRSGIPGEADPLTLGVLYAHLRHRLGTLGLPDPNQRGTDNAHAFPFTRNAAHSRNGAAAPPAGSDGAATRHAGRSWSDGARSPMPSARPRGGGGTGPPGGSAPFAGRVSKGRTFAPSLGLGWLWWLASLLPLALGGVCLKIIIDSALSLLASSAPALLLYILVLVCMIGCVYSFRLYVHFVARGTQRMKQRHARLLIVTAAGIEVRVRDQRWYYRWNDVARITERRRNFRSYLCLDPKPSAVLPSAQRSDDLSPWYDPRRGEVLLTPLSGYRAGRWEITQEIARCAGTKWAGQ